MFSCCIVDVLCSLPQVLLEVKENLTLDLLFSMLNPDLEQLLGRCGIASDEGKKLLGALDLLTSYYGKSN